MFIETKQDNSVYKWLKDQFQDVSYVNVVDGFPETSFDIPCVALEKEELTAANFELGNRAFMVDRIWFVDIYAVSKIQRDEFAYRLLHALENKINVYDYDQGFTSPPKIGVLNPENVKISIIKVLPELTEDMYYRSVVSFTTDYEDI